MTIHIAVYLPSKMSLSKSFAWFNHNHEKKISENKIIELQTGFFGWTNLFSLDIDLLPFGRDHANFGIELTILGFSFIAGIRDMRHWDDEKNTWEK